MITQGFQTFTADLLNILQSTTIQDDTKLQIFNHIQNLSNNKNILLTLTIDPCVIKTIYGKCNGHEGLIKLTKQKSISQYFRQNTAIKKFIAIHDTLHEQTQPTPSQTTQKRKRTHPSRLSDPRQFKKRHKHSSKGK